MLIPEKQLKRELLEEAGGKVDEDDERVSGPGALSLSRLWTVVAHWEIRLCRRTASN